MAILQITAFEDASEVALGLPVSEETIAITGTSEESAAIPGTKRSRRVRLFADINCFVTWGPSPTASIDGSDGRMLAAESPEYISMEAGWKVAVIAR